MSEAKATVGEVVLVERRGDVMWVTLNRPHVRNAMTREMYALIEEACRTAQRDADVRVIVLVGAGEHAFSVGADIAQFRDFKTIDDAVDYDAAGNAAFSALESCALPTIAAIHGDCVGGGALLAGSCDLRIAAPSARFGVPIARTLGNCLSTRDVNRLLALLGQTRTTDLLLTARLMSAEEMLACGVVSEITPDERSLAPRAQALAERLASFAPLTLRATKRAIGTLRALAERDDRELLASCYLSLDFRNAVDSFLAGDKPVWEGR